MTGDLISRSKVEEVISALVHEEGITDDAAVLGCMVRNAVHTMEAVDAVPVVRCGECAHRGLPACPMCHDESYYDEDDGTEYYTVDKTDDDGFCHLGARMDEEADE